MNHLNKTIIQGNLVKDPDFKDLGSSQLCKFTLASNREYTEKKETCFVDIVTWGHLASICDKYLSKGRHVLVEGRLKLDTWEANDGTKRSKLTIIANEVVFLPGSDKKETKDLKSEVMNVREIAIEDASDNTVDDLPF